MSFIVVIIISVLVASIISGRIPQTGRFGKANGEKITATITNSNCNADRVVTLRAEKDGRKFKAKLKPTEAFMWVEGDSIDIVLDKETKKYRILYNDYFRENEARLRQMILEKISKINVNFLSARITNYTKETYSLLENSSFESQRLLSFLTYMRMFDRYSIFTVVFAIVAIFGGKVFAATGESRILLIIIILVLLWALYSSSELCKKIIKQAQNEAKK